MPPKYIIGIALFFFSNLAISQDPNGGLVAYYSFCACMALDHSGNNQDGTLVGQPTCRDGLKGQGFQFNAQTMVNDCEQRGGDYIRLPDLDSDWDGGFSVCAWVQYEDNAHSGTILAIGNGTGESGGLPLWFGREGNTDNLILESWVDGDPATNQSTGRLVARGAITSGQIVFYTATIDNRTMRIYVNGNLVAEKEGHPIRNVRRTENFIGRSNWCEVKPDFAGFIDEVRLYNRPLSTQEIKSLTATKPQVRGPDQICIAQSVQLEAQGGERYQWTPGLFLDDANIPNPVAIADRDTTLEYQVEIFFPDGCSVLDTLTLKFTDCLDCAGVVSGNAVVDSCGICLEADSPAFNQSCVDCAGVPNGGARINECGACLSPDDPTFDESCPENDKVFIPTAFSPNQDGINDSFGIFGNPTYVEKIEFFQIKDRWGNLVFEVANQPFGAAESIWDGSLNGEVLPQGVYLYQTELRFSTGHAQTFTGTITLIY